MCLKDNLDYANMLHNIGLNIGLNKHIFYLAVIKHFVLYKVAFLCNFYWVVGLKPRPIL